MTLTCAELIYTGNCQRRMVRLLLIGRQNELREPQHAEYHLQMHNILLLEEDGLKQQKTGLGAAPLSQEKETEAMIHIGLLKLGNR